MYFGIQYISKHTVTHHLTIKNSCAPQSRNKVSSVSTSAAYALIRKINNSHEVDSNNKKGRERTAVGVEETQASVQPDI